MLLIKTRQEATYSYQMKAPTQTVTTPTEHHHIFEQTTTQNVSTSDTTPFNTQNKKPDSGSNRHLPKVIGKGT